MLAIKMHATGQRDLYMPMPDRYSIIPINDEEQSKGGHKRWFSWLRGRYLNRGGGGDLEAGLGTESEIAFVHASFDPAHPAMRQIDWGVKSLRTPGVWGGRSK